MPGTTVRVSESTHALLREIADRVDQPMSAVVRVALEEYRRRLFWSLADREFQALRTNSEAWQEHQEELAVWDAAAADGLDSENER
jgi:hypothetical protein